MFSLKIHIDDRCVALGNYIVENHSTVRAAATAFGISKSTVHKDVSVRLQRVNPALYEQVKKVLEIRIVKETKSLKEIRLLRE